MKIYMCHSLISGASRRSGAAALSTLESTYKFAYYLSLAEYLDGWMYQAKGLLD
jgi:hypothetical protein